MQHQRNPRSGPAAISRLPITDPELAEEVAHAPLHRLGVTDRRMFYLATLIAQACVALNVAREAGLPYGVLASNLRQLTTEMERRLLRHHLEVTPDSEHRDWWIWRLSQVGEPMMNIVPPAGWMESA